MALKEYGKVERCAVVVLGMHRSGTSALSGILHLLGCDVPKTLMPPREANEKGFFESLALYDFHNKLLESGGSSWADWQPFHEGWFPSPRAAEFQQRATEILREEFDESRLFLLKDPRICRLVPFWVKTLEDAHIRPLILHTHRNPVDVAASLTRHHNISSELCVLLWLRHVLDAERNTRNLPRHFTSYPRLLNGWRGELKRSQETLGISFPRQSSRVQADVGNFLETSLQHFSATADQLVDDLKYPDWVRTTFDIMERWAETGEDPADHTTLDQIAKEFDQAGPAFAQLISDGENSRKKLKTRGATIETLGANQKALIKQYDASCENLSAAKKEHGEVQSQLADLKGLLEAKEEAERETALQMKTVQGKLLNLHEEQALLQSRLRQREIELSQATSAQDQTAQKLASKENKLSKRTNQIADLEESLAARFGEVAKLTQMVIEAEKKTTTKQQAELQSDNDRLKFENMALRSSSSWRLTAPLRKISTLLRPR